VFATNAVKQDNAPMRKHPTFDEAVTASLSQLSLAEGQVVQYFRDNREEVMVASAAILASRIGTSDATVIRAVKALGYSGLDALRQNLAAELRRNLSPASRLARTLGEMGPESAFGATIDIHVKALEDLRRDVSADLFHSAVDRIAESSRVAVFGIGPSSAMADYLTIQLGRFGIDSLSLTQTGLLLADGLQRLRRGDLAIILAYSRVYPELEALLGRTAALGLATILVTDTLGATLRKRVDLVLPVERGRADGLSMHTATLALFESLLVGVAAKRPAETIANLKLLNDLRARLAGTPMDLPMPEIGSREGAKRKERKSRS
jgi:DNA-binding MurR/RpiR family transcriptional regulator